MAEEIWLSILGKPISTVPFSLRSVTLVLKQHFRNIQWMSQNVRKRTFWCGPMKTQISLCIQVVWSESSLSAWRHFASLAIQNAHSKDSDQTVHLHSLIWIFAGCTCPKICFLILQLINHGISTYCPFDISRKDVFCLAFYFEWKYFVLIDHI